VINSGRLAGASPAGVSGTMGSHRDLVNNLAKSNRNLYERTFEDFGTTLYSQVP
jgi:hypothetical protein